MGLSPQSVGSDVIPGRQCQHLVKRQDPACLTENYLVWETLHIWYQKCCEFGGSERVKKNHRRKADAHWV